MKSLILSIIFFLLVTLAVVDSIVWHHNDDKKVACTVVFKAEPTVSRTGRPYYYFEVRRNDNNEWHQISVSGETYSTIGKGDQLVADFNNDDSLEIFIVGGYSEYPAFQSNYGRAYMITAGKGNGPDWLMFQHDIRRQSSLCENAANAINESNTPDALSIQIFPNPSNTSITIRFSNPKNENYTLIIYNAMEQIVQKNENIISTEIKVENRNWQSGLYFFQLQYKGIIIGQGKFIIKT